jgi:KaiC/GvpD/RAD55 family RecA-like ATPase
MTESQDPIAEAVRKALREAHQEPPQEPPAATPPEPPQEPASELPQETPREASPEPPQEPAQQPPQTLAEPAAAGVASEGSGSGRAPPRQAPKGRIMSVFDLAKIKRALRQVTGRGELPKGREFLMTGIPGFDELFDYGIPRKSNIIIAGGAGTGKTIMCLQMLANAAARGEKCLFMSFEESEERLVQHMKDFGWNPEELMRKGNLMIRKFSPYDVSRFIEAMVAKSKGELVIDVKPIILPAGFTPSLIAVDSVSSIASAFPGEPTGYRNYIERLFSYFQEIGATSFFVTETSQMPRTFSPTGAEEFLADGVIVLYSIMKGDIRENAIEVLKMRGAGHRKRVVAMRVTGGSGVEVFPKQEIFSDIVPGS